MYVPVHAANGRASCAPSFGLFLRTFAAPHGAPYGRHPAAEAVARAGAKTKNKTKPRFPCRPHQRSPWMDGARARTGAVRGAEHRRRDGKVPAGSRRWIAAIAQQYTDVLSEQPRRAEKHRAFAAQERRNHRVRRLAFLPTFWAMPKSRRLAAGESKLCTRIIKYSKGAGFRLTPE